MMRIFDNVTRPSLLLCCLLMAAALLAGIAVAAPPSIISHQGYLKSAGKPVTGQMSMAFSLYSTTSGAGPLWRETQIVSLNKGAYNVNLGSVTPLGLPFDRQYYLGVQAGTEPELRPLQPLTSVPYAKRALVAEKVINMPSIMTLQVDGIGTLDVLAWSWGISQSSTTPPASVQDLSVTVYDSMLCARLEAACAAGTVIPTIVFTDLETASGLRKVLTLTNCLVTSVSVGGSGGQVSRTANISINFSTFSLECYEIAPDGTTTLKGSTGWDIVNNRLL